ncbi:MAG: hypothetical protein P8N73_11825 [Pseudomonadales bacterium]|jgi:hypothetical protein|nr:hypothetical protein [Pseudomonadales bacterium]
MNKPISAVFITAAVLFVFGFLYWAVNPLPYSALNQVKSEGISQLTVAKLFPESGAYLIPGPGPKSQERLEKGPAILLSIDHMPSAAGAPLDLFIGFLHNLATAFLLALILGKVKDNGERMKVVIISGVLATVLINGSEVIWWFQPLNWVAYHALYYILYFSIAGALLCRLLPSEEETTHE